METVGARVRREREAQGISRPELAKRAGLGYSTLAELERGGMQTTTKLRAIAEALGVSQRWLESGKGAKASIQQPSQVVGLDAAKLADLVETVDAAVAGTRLERNAKVKARLVTTLYMDDQVSAAGPAAVRAMLASILSSMEEAP